MNYSRTKEKILEKEVLKSWIQYIENDIVRMEAQVEARKNDKKRLEKELELYERGN